MRCTDVCDGVAAWVVPHWTIAAGVQRRSLVVYIMRGSLFDAEPRGGRRDVGYRGSAASISADAALDG